jgi:predicted outer membrane repeat protein
MRRSLLILVAVLLLCCSAALARTWYVKHDGAGDVPVIQAAVDSAALGDTVLLADGTYSGDGNRDVDFHGKAVVVTSESRDPHLCVISCEGVESASHRGFLLVSGETEATVLEGVTVEGGYMDTDVGYFPDYSGAGVLCSYSSPTIRRCHFVGNRAKLGAAIVCSDGSPVITECAFQENEGFEWTGGAIMCINSGSPTISGCTFSENLATTDYANWLSLGGAVAVMAPSTPALTGCAFIGNSATAGAAIWYDPFASLTITDCVFSQNVAEEGGAISCRYDGPGPAATYGLRISMGSVEVSGCTFERNSAVRGGALHFTESAEVSITGCTLHGNEAEQGAGMYVDTFVAVLEKTVISFGQQGEAVYVHGGGLNSDVSLSCCDLYGNAGGDWVAIIADQLGANGNFSADPRFCGTLGGNFRVENCSPCLPGNHTDGYDCGGIIGAFGTGCECGAPTEPTTWGAIKAVYR